MALAPEAEGEATAMEGPAATTDAGPEPSDAPPAAQTTLADLLAADDEDSAETEVFSRSSLVHGMPGALDSRHAGDDEDTIRMSAEQAHALASISPMQGLAPGLELSEELGDGSLDDGGETVRFSTDFGSDDIGEAVLDDLDDMGGLGLGDDLQGTVGDAAFEEGGTTEAFAMGLDDGELDGSSFDLFGLEDEPQSLFGRDDGFEHPPSQDDGEETIRFNIDFDEAAAAAGVLEEDEASVGMIPGEVGEATALVGNFPEGWADDDDGDVTQPFSLDFDGSLAGEGVLEEEGPVFGVHNTLDSIEPPAVDGTASLAAEPSGEGSSASESVEPLASESLAAEQVPTAEPPATAADEAVALEESPAPESLAEAQPEPLGLAKGLRELGSTFEDAETGELTDDFAFFSRGEVVMGEADGEAMPDPAPRPPPPTSSSNLLVFGGSAIAVLVVSATVLAAASVYADRPPPPAPAPVAAEVQPAAPLAEVPEPAPEPEPEPEPEPAGVSARGAAPPAPSPMPEPQQAAPRPARSPPPPVIADDDKRRGLFRKKN